MRSAKAKQSRSSGNRARGARAPLRSALGLHADITPLLSHSTTGEFNSPPKSLRTTTRCTPLGSRARHGHRRIYGCGGARHGHRRTDCEDLIEPPCDSKIQLSRQFFADVDTVRVEVYSAEPKRSDGVEQDRIPSDRIESDGVPWVEPTRVGWRPSDRTDSMASLGSNRLDGAPRIEPTRVGWLRRIEPTRWRPSNRTDLSRMASVGSNQLDGVPRIEPTCRMASVGSKRLDGVPRIEPSRVRWRPSHGTKNVGRPYLAVSSLSRRFNSPANSLRTPYVRVEAYRRGTIRNASCATKTRPEKKGTPVGVVDRARGPSYWAAGRTVGAFARC
eukprot:1189940-Prorocentrum_minimum.AAC.1